MRRRGHRLKKKDRKRLQQFIRAMEIRSRKQSVAALQQGFGSQRRGWYW
jgi:hypothetical protein